MCENGGFLLSGSQMFWAYDLELLKCDTEKGWQKSWILLRVVSVLQENLPKYVS